MPVHLMFCFVAWIFDMCIHIFIGGELDNHGKSRDISRIFLVPARDLRRVLLETTDSKLLFLKP